MQRYGRSKYAQKLGFRGEKVNPDSKYLRSAWKPRHGWIRARRSCRGRRSEERRGRPVWRARRSGAPAARRRGRGDRGGGVARRRPEAAAGEKIRRGGAQATAAARGGSGRRRGRGRRRGHRTRAAGRWALGGPARAGRAAAAAAAGCHVAPHEWLRAAAGAIRTLSGLARTRPVAAGSVFLARVGRGEIRDPKTGRAIYRHKWS